VAASLRAEGFEVFCPHIRYEKARKTGKVWANEALFPNYLFSRFEYTDRYRWVLSTRGVLKIIGFGGSPALVPEHIISELRLAVCQEETIEIESRVDEGDTVNVIDGPLKGIQAIVSRVMPGRDRVLILMDLLGEEREVEVSSEDLLADHENPLERNS